MTESIAFKKLIVGEFFTTDLAMCIEKIPPNIDPFAWVKIGEKTGFHFASAEIRKFDIFHKEVCKLDLSIKRV